MPGRASLAPAVLQACLCGGGVGGWVAQGVNRRALPFARPSCRFDVSVCAPSPGLVPLPSVWV
eukprot:7386341-Prymnesium_polylepis.1